MNKTDSNAKQEKSGEGKGARSDRRRDMPAIRKARKIRKDADRLDEAAKLLSDIARVLVDIAVEQSEDGGKLSKEGKRLRDKSRELLKDIADIHEEAIELRKKTVGFDLDDEEREDGETEGDGEAGTDEDNG